MGSATALNILLGLVRVKVAAIILGTAGLGLVSLLQSFMATGASIGGLGLSQSGTRQIAAGRAAGEGPEANARRALFLATAFLAIFAGALVWLLRGQIAEQILGNAASSQAVGWMALGIGLTIAAFSQTALIAGLGRVADVGRVSVATACISTTIALASLWLLREQAVLPYLLAVPIASVFAGWYYARRVRPTSSTPRLSDLTEEWRHLFSLGAAVMVSSIALNIAQLTVRSLIGHRIGLTELGLFQAASTISVTYLGFVLQAMSVDYYPRLSALPAGSTESQQLVNDQTEIALMLGAPVILAMMGPTEWILRLLYTAEFSNAAAILRWQVMGDILRLASWPLAFTLLASSRGRTYVMLELTAFAAFVGSTYLLIPAIGAEAAGIGYLIMYAIYLPLTFVAIRAQGPFRWSWQVGRSLLGLMAAAGLLHALSIWNSLAAAGSGLGLASVAAVLAFRRVQDLFPNSRLARLGRR
jgi:PST family polysaccharide transporter